MVESTERNNVQITVVGGGQAAATLLRALRTLGFSGQLTLFGDEPHAPYERPPLSKAILSGAAELGSSECLGAADAERLGVEMRLGRRVAAIDPGSRTLRTASGETHRYDRLVLATGGRARHLPDHPADRRRVFTLRGRDDAAALRDALATPATVLVLGGGWLGLEIAATARRMGHAVHLVESAPRLCARTVPREVSEDLLRLHRDAGVDVRLGTTATVARRDDDRPVLRLGGGDELVGDVLVVAIGLEPETDLARAAGLAVGDGILVDAHCRTSDPHVYAIGDCACTLDPATGEPVRGESWQNADRQADAAARALVGLEPPPPVTPWFWSEQYDHVVQLLGHTGENCTALRRGTGSTPGPVLYLDAGRLVGIAAFSNPREIRTAGRLIAAGARLDPRRAADPTLPLERCVIQDSEIHA